MEIKAQLEKPYTEEQRIQFIVDFNHKLGYAIQETETHLNAMEYTEKESQQQERERLDMLFMTGSDVERAIYKVKGMDFDDILAMVKDNPTIDVKALKIEFKANNFYRGNPYISQVGTLLGFTSEQMDRFFDTKDWHYLTNCNIKVTLRADEKPETEPIVTINGVETKETTLPYGSTCTIKVECDGYKTLQPEDFTVTEDMHIELQLIKGQATDVSNEVETKTTDKPNAN